MGISALLIVKNEEKMIGDCLKSLNWVDEIIVLDGDSIDRTVEVCKKYQAKVVNFPKSKDFADRRNRLVKEAQGDWLFYIDADERVTPELRDEILKITNYKLQIINSAYAIPRKNFIFGKEFKYGGQWPDYVKRLFLKSMFRGWKGALHEEPIFEGKLGHLKNPLFHLKHETIAEMVEKTNDWSEIEAKLMFEAHHPEMNIARFISAALHEFWLRMIKQTAFLDGEKGIIYALYQVFSRLVSYTKLWEMQIKL